MVDLTDHVRSRSEDQDDFLGQKLSNDNMVDAADLHQTRNRECQFGNEVLLKLRAAGCSPLNKTGLKIDSPQRWPLRFQKDSN